MADALGIRIGMPDMATSNGSTIGRSSVSLSASTYRMAYVFQSHDTSAITHLGFSVAYRSGTPPTYRVSIQGVNTSTGNPDGTIKGGGSPASGTFTPPASSAWDSTFQWVALSNSYTPSRGELLSLVVDYSSGTINGSNCVALYSTATNAIFYNSSIPFCLTDTGGSYVKQSPVPLFGVRTASTRYGNVFASIYSSSSTSTVGRRVAMKFTLPTGWANTFTVRGFRFSGALASTTGKNPIAGLWGSGGVLQNVTLDSDIPVNATSNYQMKSVIFDESTLSTLSTGTAYYIGLEVADATGGELSINGVQLSDSGDLAAYPLGANAFLSTYNGSSWTDDQTVRPFVELFIDDISGGGSSGSLMLRRNFDGGF